MSDVLIRGIEIPKNCAECRFCVNGFTDDAPMYECVCETYENVSILVDDHGMPFDFKPEWCPLIEIQSDIDLIDKNKLYEKVAEWEAQALEQASKLAQTDNIEEWRRWSTILNERTAFKFDVADAPVIIPAE